MNTPKIILLMDNPMVPTGYASTCRLTARELIRRGWEVYAPAFNGGIQSGPNGEPIWEFDGAKETGPDGVVRSIKVIGNEALSRNSNAIYGDPEFFRWMEDTIQPDIYMFHNDSYRYSYAAGLPESIFMKSVFWLPFEGDRPDVGGTELFKRFPVVRFVTRYAMDMHAEMLKDAGTDVGYIYHAVDTAHMRPLDGKKRDIKEKKPFGIADKFVVARVDRHQPRKHWKLTLETFAKFAQGKDDVFLLCKCNPRDLVMWNEEKKEGVALDLVADGLGITDKVFFDDFFFDVGFMPEAFYWPADVFLTTTSGEGFGLTPVEAMACGLPVIYHDTPVLPEVIDDGGFKFDRAGREWYDPMKVWHNIADLDSAANALQQAYEDWKSGGPRLKEAGLRARQLVEERYSPTVVYDQWDSVLRGLMNRGKMVSMVTVLYNCTGNEQIYGEDGVNRLWHTLKENVSHPFEWILVDNGSPARTETREWMAKVSAEDDRIVCVELDTNLGYAGGNNVGIARAQGRKVLLVNPDSEAIPPKKHGHAQDFVGLMADQMDSDPSLGILGMEEKDRDDIMPGLNFPYFGCVMLSQACLDKVKLGASKWFDENYWPAYYEDADLCLRAKSKGLHVKTCPTLPFWHKSGGTNKYLIDKPPTDPAMKAMMSAAEKLKATRQIAVDDATMLRKLGEGAAAGMQGLINGNISYLNAKWGVSARQKIKIVFHTHIGAAVGFSAIAEGLAPELHRLGFDVYINDWSNGSNVDNVEDDLLRDLILKTKEAKESGDSLYNAIHVVCWLMETYADVDGAFKVGISFCESTRVRDSYLHLCNSMDGILTFSDFCKTIQQKSGFKAPIHVIPPGVGKAYLNYHERHFPKVDEGEKFTFLSVGVAQGRKDTRRLVESFCEAFPKDKPHPPEENENFPLSCDQVELVLKSNNFGDLQWVHDQGWSQKANIRTIFTGWGQAAERQDYTSGEMYNLFCSAHALVHPSHGEGIGLPILEAASTGLPCIFTNWSSPAEYLDETTSFPCSLSPYPGTTFTKAYPDAPGDNGVWANVHVGHMKFLMYEVIKDYENAKQRGRKASVSIEKNYNWSSTARMLWPMIMEWDERRRQKPQSGSEFSPLTFTKPSLDKVSEGDRVMIDVATRDRRPYLATLLTSLLCQSFKDWDITIQVDDADESILHDHLIRSLLERLRHEGHVWKMIRSNRQGPHMAHQRTLQMTSEEGRHKLICRIDDDIYVKPDYLEKLFGQFLQDKNCELGAVSGVYVDPKRTDSDQMAPPGYQESLDYAGQIDHNVPWPYVCLYPPGTKPREVEHLYSSFMYRTEVAQAIGGYCKLFSQIGHREESDFSYRFWLAGYKLLVHPEAVGFHFQAPASGIRSIDIQEKESLAETDHKIYMKRLSRWKEELGLKKSREQERAKELAVKQEPKGHSIACVLQGGDDPGQLVSAINYYGAYCDKLYASAPEGLPLPDDLANTVDKDAVDRIAATGEGPAGVANVFREAMSSDCDFIMTVSDQMTFLGDPGDVLSDDYDEYMFEVYSTYDKPGARELCDRDIGPECRNMCLISRRGVNKTTAERRKYTDVIVIDDQRLAGQNGASVMGNPLIRFGDIHFTNWTKFCIFQHPEGKLDPPRISIARNSRPLVSIIIPTPGRKNELKRCLDSIYSHTTTSFEVIVVDNASTDGTTEMLEAERRSRSGIRVLRQSVNLGYQKSINVAVSQARGEYLLLFNDDAWVEHPEPDGQDWLRALMDELDADPEVGIVGPHRGESPALKKEMLYFWCVMMKNTTWDKVGPLDDVTFFNYGGDDDYCERLRAAGFKIKQKYVHLRHDMNHVPEHEKNAELAESRAKLRNKYEAG